MNLLSELMDRLAPETRGTYTRHEDAPILARLAKLNARDGFTLTHALSVAAERFDHDAKAFDEAAAEAAAAEGGRTWITADGAKRLAEQFRTQAADVRELIAVIEDDESDEELLDKAEQRLTTQGR